MTPRLLRNTVTGRTLLSLGLVGMVIGSSSRANAVDTLEVYAPGLSDAEVYLGAERLGESKHETSTYASFGFGAGLHERLALYAGIDSVGNGALGEGSSGPNLLLYATVIDSFPFALDLGAQLSESDGSLATGPLCEVNFDFAPGQALAGLFLHGGPVAVGQAEAVNWSFEGGLGGYLSVSERTQLLVEWVSSYDLGVSPASSAMSHGALLFGVNSLVTENIELIHEFSLTLPDSGTDAGVGAMLGFVASLPTAN